MHPAHATTQHIPVIPVSSFAPALTRRYTARIQNTDCTLELRFDHTGSLTGEFIADGEHLEIIGGVPNNSGQVFGLILEPDGDTLAVFRATPTLMGLDLEMDLPKQDDLFHLGNAERLHFKRLEVDHTPRGVGRRREAARAGFALSYAPTRAGGSR